MKIVIPTVGSRGDVQPFIALAQGLNCAGHQVIIATHPGMRALVESHGVAFAPIGPDIDMAVEAAVIRRQNPNVLVSLAKTMKYAVNIMEHSHTEILAACQQAGLVVPQAASACGKNEAELLKLPYLSVSLMPWSIPYDDPTRPRFKRLLYSLIDSLVSLMTTQPLNRVRKRLGLPPVGREGFTSMQLNLVPVSMAVYPLSPYWEPRHRMVGY